MTSNDIFIAAEISTRDKERDDLAQEKKLCLQSKATEDKARAILEQGKSINKLNVSDLNALFGMAWGQNATEVEEGGQVGAVETNFGRRRRAAS